MLQNLVLEFCAQEQRACVVSQLSPIRELDFGSAQESVFNDEVGGRSDPRRDSTNRLVCEQSSVILECGCAVGVES